MLVTRRSRLATVFFFLVTLLALAVWYGSLGPAPALGDYPSQENLATDYDQYLGTRVTVGGSVTSTSPVTIAAPYGTGETLTLEITALETTAAPGERLYVYGIVKGNHRVRAIDAFTVPQSGLWYTWGVSFLAGLWVLARVVRYWRLTDRLALEPRPTPLFEEDDTDA